MTSYLNCDIINSMNIPKTITILGRKYTVIRNVSSKKLNELNDTEDRDLWALAVLSDKKIYIATHKTKEEEYVTFFHECVHVAEKIVGLDQITNKKIREIWCETMGNMMYDVFKGMK